MIRQWTYPGAQLLHRHPFAAQADDETQGLILGTFPAKQFTDPRQPLRDEDWYYSSAGNRLWELLFYAFAQSYAVNIGKQAKQNLLQQHRLGISDIVEQAYRIRNSNQDNNLHVQAVRCLDELLAQAPQLTRLYLTSKSMYKEFFLPAYFGDGQSLPQQVDTIRVDGSCSAEVYRFSHGHERQMEVVLLPSPARMRAGLEAMKSLYRKVFTGCHSKQSRF
ncbi:MAG: hypothetical protein J7K75_02785 [Desulfuromonas sp.]|nr:hypothetical protein [Desulfuromonas sp.]